MRCAILTTLFLTLFALFSAVAYAAPIDPQGVISKRCSMAECRNASTNTPGSGSTDALLELISKIVNLYSGNTPDSPPPAVVSTSPSAAANPTGN